MKKSPMQIARVSVYDKTNGKWFEPYEIRNILSSFLKKYPEEFEVKIY